MSKNTNNEQNKINFKKSRSIVDFLGLEEKNSNTVFFYLHHILNRYSCSLRVLFEGHYKISGTPILIR